jgi:hypothetical protein
MDSLSIQDSTDSDARYTGYSSANGTLYTSMNSGAGSSGGVRLSAGVRDDGGWQSAPGTRARRGVASSTGANSSGFSTASISTAVGPQRGSTFDKNAYGNPKAPASIAGSMASSSWSTPASAAAPSSGNKNFKKIKARNLTDEEFKDKWADSVQSAVSVIENKIRDPESDSDQDSDVESSDEEEDSDGSDD